MNQPHEIRLDTIWRLGCDPNYYVRVDGFNTNGKLVRLSPCNAAGNRRRTSCVGSSRIKTFLAAYTLFKTLPAAESQTNSEGS